MRRGLTLLLFALLISHPATSSAQDVDSLSVDTARQEKPEKGFKPLKWALSTMDKITEFLQGCDTSYITPQKYEFTAQAELGYFYDYYYMSSNSDGTRQSMTMHSGNPLSVGAYIYWGPLGFGHSWNVEDIGKGSSGSGDKGNRNVFMLNTARIIAELYTFRSGKSTEITDIKGTELNGNLDFAGLSSKCIGFDMHYIFNNRKYSWPAAFGENAVQRKSAGTFMAGISYNKMDISFDKSKLSSSIISLIDTTQLFSKINYTDYGISIGYCYNWPFAKNCLLAVSAIPTIGYRKSDAITEKLDYNVLDQISTDLFFRASLFWNNTKYFSGIVLDLHTYFYRKEEFDMATSYGTLKYILGFNFLKKAKYKDKKRAQH